MFFYFWSIIIIQRQVSPQLKKDQRERNQGALMLPDEREMKMKRNCRERRNHTRESSSSPSTAERGGTWVLLAVANLEFHVDLVLGEKSLRCFIFAICVNNVLRMLCYFHNVTFVTLKKMLVTGNYVFCECYITTRCYVL